MSAPPGLYEQVLAAGGAALVAAKPARPSAAVVPWRRRGGTGLEVFWIRRGRVMPLMAGWHAFPGGGLDRGDAALPVAGEPRHPGPHPVTAPSADGELPADPDLVPGLAACALRELFEETGLLLVVGHPASGGAGDAAAAARLALLERRRGFAEIVAAAGGALDAGRLVFAGRWRTPPFAPVLFDNRFFLFEWRAADGEPAIAPPENEEGEWLAPEAALERIASGDALVAPPILHLLRVLAEQGPEAGLDRLLDASETHLGPLRRIELRPGILLFPQRTSTLPPAGYTNAYLLGTSEAALVDPGSSLEEENARLLAALEAAREQLGRRTVEIWLTHHHPDHVGGVERIRHALGVPVAAHAATAERLAARGIAVDRLLVGGSPETLAGDPPFRLRLHHTPGHARGHLCVEVEETRDLLVGDLVAGLGTIVIDPPEGDLDDYLESLARMRELGARTLFPAHGAPILDARAKLDEYLEHRLERERQILAAWTGGARTPGAIVAEVYTETPAPLHGLAQRQVVAHLERLQRRGAIPGAPWVER